MHALRSAMLMMLPLSLAGCGPELPPLAVAVPVASSPAARHAEIRKQLSARCPGTLTPAELDRWAGYLDQHPKDSDARALVGRLDRFDQESWICRTGGAA